MAIIGIIGSGNVGANTAFFIAERNIADVVMYDIQEGLAAGKALDLMEAAPIRGYEYGISAATSMEEILEAEIVVVTAGSVREPGMKREELLAKNSTIIDGIAAQFRGFGGIVAVATEPVDPMTMRFVGASGMAPERVIGLGGVLDSTRLRHFLAESTGVSAENVSALVIGRHSDEMIPLIDYARINGVPAEVLIGAEGFADLAEKTRTAGDVIVEMAQRASAYYGPSAAAADVCEAVIRDSKRILSVSFVWGKDDPYGVSGDYRVAMSLPVVLGAGGVERVLKPNLSEDEWERLHRSARNLAVLMEDADYGGTDTAKGGAS